LGVWSYLSLVPTTLRNSHAPATETAKGGAPFGYAYLISDWYSEYRLMIFQFNFARSLRRCLPNPFTPSARSEEDADTETASKHWAALVHWPTQGGMGRCGRTPMLRLPQRKRRRRRQRPGCGPTTSRLRRVVFRLHGSFETAAGPYCPVRGSRYDTGSATGCKRQPS
jgi:hypothetical protein